jgi:hypothetical protein
MVEDLHSAPSCRVSNSERELVLTSVAECLERTRREMTALQQLVALLPTSAWAALQRFDADASKSKLASLLWVAP